MDLSNFGINSNKITLKPSQVEDSKLDINFSSIRLDYRDDNIFERYLPWFLKYQIGKKDDLTETKEIKKIISFFESFKPGKGLLLVGGPGSGKTTTLTVLAKHYKLDLFELNASDVRNKKSIKELVGDAVKQKSLFNIQKLILIDEVDGVSGTNDRGGVAELSRIVKESPFPVVFTANDKDSKKIKALKKVVQTINFENDSEILLLSIGKKILEKENVSFSEVELKQFISQRSTVDIRGFINDLQASVQNQKLILNDDLEIRDYKKKISELLDLIFYSYPENSFNSSRITDISLDDLILYLEENLPLVYTKKDLLLAFNELSKADVKKGRIIRWQYWRYLVYVHFYLTYGVSSVKTNPVRIKDYKKNNRILKKWIYSNKLSVLNSEITLENKSYLLIDKLSLFYGRSKKKFLQEDFRYFLFNFQNNEIFRNGLIRTLNLSEKQELFLLSYKL